MEFERAAKPMGKSVAWSEEDLAAAPEKKVYLGKQFQGILDGRDSWKNEEGKEQMIYRILLENGEYVSVWQTAMIRAAMEEGFKGSPIPLGCTVRFTHQGMKKSPTKGRKPYHNVLVEFAKPNPSFSPAAAAKSDNPFED